MTASAVAPLAVALPLLAATLLPVVSELGGKRRMVDLLSVASAVGTLAVDLLVLIASCRAPFVYWFGGWKPDGGFPLGIAFLVEPFGAGAAALAALLTVAGLVFSARHFDAYGTFFHSLVLVFLAAMSGFCLAGDFFNQFVFFELMGVAAYALTGYRVEDTGPLEGGLNFAVMNSIGAIAILMGIGLVYGRTGSLNMAEAGTGLAAGPADILVAAALVLFLCGYFVKGALFPFHFWLPDAHTVAPTAASVLFSGVMVEIALLGALRVYQGVFLPVLGDHDREARLAILVLGSVTALLGGIMATAQRHLKRLLAFSTVSHSGLIAAALAIFRKEAVAGAFIYLLGHGLVKGTLFLCAGIILHRKRSVDELDLRGAGRDLPVCGILFFLAAAGLAGLPPFATFAGKGLMEAGAKNAGFDWFTWITAAASALTAAAVFRAGGRIFLGLGRSDPVTATARTSGSIEGPETRGARGRTPATMWGAASLLTGAAILSSLPAVSAAAISASNLYLDPALIQRLVLSGGLVPPGVGKPFSPGTEAYLTSAGIALLALLLAGLFLARSGKVGVPAWRDAVAVMKPLRDIHSGYVGDYAAWFAAGCGTLLLILAALLR